MGAITKLFKSVAGANPSRYVNSVIIAAAGCGSRMGSDKTKQMMTVGDIPVVIRSVLAFDECPFLSEIIIAAKKEEMTIYRALIERYSIKKVRFIVPGGDTRQQSVLLALKKVSPKSDFLAVHDAARCMITREMIEKVFCAAIKYGAASAGMRMSDTVKQTDASDNVISTPDRETLWRAQTPQVFKTDLYRCAAYYARANDFIATDDNSLVENIGARVRMVDCGGENFKITTPEDLIFANALVKSRKGDFSL